MRTIESCRLCCGSYIGLLPASRARANQTHLHRIYQQGSQEKLQGCSFSAALRGAAFVSAEKQKGERPAPRGQSARRRAPPVVNHRRREKSGASFGERTSQGRFQLAQRVFTAGAEGWAESKKEVGRGGKVIRCFPELTGSWSDATFQSVCCESSRFRPN